MTVLSSTIHPSGWLRGTEWFGHPFQSADDSQRMRQVGSEEG